MSVDLGRLFGKGAAAEQLLVWGVLNQVLAAVLAPTLQELQRGVNELQQAVPLSPADLADMVVKAILPEGDGESFAKQSGVAPSDFRRLVQNAGQPIGLQEALQAWRRDIIGFDGAGPDRVTVEQAVRESHTYTKWLGVIQALADVPIGVADAVDAVVEGQISHSDGERIAGFSGVNADNFQILVNTRGNPPSPSELAELLKRGFIPLEGTGPDQVSFQQGIFEGATKDKWWQLFSKLADYVPPPRTVTAMVREGSLSDQQALQLFQASGLSPDLAASYLTSAHHQKTATTRNLTVSTIVSLYKDSIVDRQTAGNLLLALNYSQEDATFELKLADFDVAQTFVRSAVGRLETLFVNHKLDATQVSSALDGLEIPPAARDRLIQKWQLEAANNVKVLTPAQIAGAVKYGYFSFPEGVAALVAEGYSQRDATVYLGVELHIPAQAPTA